MHCAQFWDYSNVQPPQIWSLPSWTLLIFLCLERKQIRVLTIVNAVAQRLLHMVEARTAVWWERWLMVVRHELWCVLEPTGDSQSNCNNRNHNLGYRTQNCIVLWTFIIWIVKESVMQKLIATDLFTFFSSSHSPSSHLNYETWDNIFHFFC